MSEPFSTPRMVELEAEIAATRVELALSVDSLARRLTPRELAAEAGRQARSGAEQARSAVEQLVRDATSAEADPEASTRARVILAGAATVAALAVATALLRRRG